MTAHPRVCGENRTSPRATPRPSGSSPRVRGKLVHHLEDRAPGRLIPACAGKTRPRAGNHPATPAHPRVCGENSRAALYPAMRVGSSPRVRGKQRRQHHHLPPRRLIPACAGKTASSPRIARPRRAHPRVCGENIFKWHRRSRRTGSSPRVRGKREQVPWPVPREGLIPACAGKTPGPPSTSRARWAHPRVCGENDNATALQCARHGSSPRVRGKLDERGLDALPPRLIPACAGKTPRPRCGTSSPGAHPRVCGENPNPATFTWTCGGSSPRVRGKPSWGSTAAPSSRLIPACAGKTWPTAPPSWFRRAHPRVCGENTHASSCACAIFGSSPRVRGKRPPRPSGTRRRRLIPACAGKTRPWAHADLRQEAHPRVCGENMRRPCRMFSCEGSSPRVRGKPTTPVARRGSSGLIPACAGKTGCAADCEP